MHELSITQSVVDLVAERTVGRTVVAVHVRVGRLSGVVADAMRFCFEVASAGTPVEVTVTPAPAPAPSPASARVAMHTVLVTDHGPGIPAQEQTYVFERFWRGDSSRHRQSGGSGLGLAIVASIVGAHGGTSEVISAPGEGTTIQIRLPTTADPHSVRERPEPSVPQPHTEPVRA